MGQKITKVREFVNVQTEKLRRDSSSSGSTEGPDPEETGHDPAIHGARLEDRFYNNDSFQSMSVDSSDPQQQEAALKIQTEVRRHQAAQEVDSMREEDAATKIQAGVRGHQDREKVADMKESSSEKANTTATSEEVDIDLNDPDVADAAIKIQAGFKGYKARKEVKEKKEAHSAKSEPLAPTEATEAELNEAASRIQAGFRGHKTRQEIKTMQDSKEGVKSDESMETPKQEEAKQEEEVDIDLKDPDTEQAALKIQAGFRGYKTRKEVKEKMEEAKSLEKQDEEKTEEKPEEKTEEKKEETTEAKPEESKTE